MAIHLLAYRKIRKIQSQEELARLTGLSVSTISRIEQMPEADVTLKVLVRLADALDITIDTLIADPEELLGKPSEQEPEEHEAGDDN